MSQVKITVVNSAGQEILRRVVKGGVVLLDRTIEVKRPTATVTTNDDDDDDHYEEDTIEKINTLTILPGRDHMIIIEDDPA